MKTEEQGLEMQPELANGFNCSIVADERGVVLVGPEHRLRRRAESYIRRVYRKAFSAQVSHFSSQLLVKLDSRQRIVGVVGLTLAGQQPLFVEQYLSETVAALLAGVSQSAVQSAGQSAVQNFSESGKRMVADQKIIEIGNLAMLDRCSVRQMICFLSDYLLEQQVDWVVFTARAELLNSFKRLALPLTHLGAADPGQLADQNSRWGSYYNGSPVVVAGRLNDVLSQRLISNAQSSSQHKDDPLGSQESLLVKLAAMPELFSGLMPGPMPALQLQ